MSWWTDIIKGRDRDKDKMRAQQRMYEEQRAAAEKERLLLEAQKKSDREKLDAKSTRSMQRAFRRPGYQEAQSNLPDKLGS